MTIGGPVLAVVIGPLSAVTRSDRSEKGKSCDLNMFKPLPSCATIIRVLVAVIDSNRREAKAEQCLGGGTRAYWVRYPFRRTPQVVYCTA